MANFVLGTSTLGGSDFNYAENIIEDRGRSIQVQWSQAGSDQDIEVSGYSIRFYPAELEPKEQL